VPENRSRKSRKRLWAGLGLLAVAGALVLLVRGGLKDNLVYFLTPTELQARGASAYGEAIRLGGQVEPGTVQWNADAHDLRFIVTDGKTKIPVHSTGTPPSMFQAGIGVVVEGKFAPDGIFQSDNLMVKHSNEYHPPTKGESPRETFKTLLPGNGSGGGD
jgi:cytochrome c-type biogenesis protein CcmE